MANEFCGEVERNRWGFILSVLLDKTEHTHPKNGLTKVWKTVKKAPKNGVLPFKNA